MLAPNQPRHRRLLGCLLLLQLLLGLSVNFGLMGRILAQPGGFLVNAGAMPHLTGLGAVLCLCGGLLMLAVTLVATQDEPDTDSLLARWVQSLGVVCVALTAFEGAALLGMASFSQAHAAASGNDQAILGVVEIIVRKTRSWAHLTDILVAALTLLSLYVLLGRRRAIPAALAWFGSGAAALQMGTMLSPMLGFGYHLALVAPIGLANLILALWLLLKR